MQTIAQQTQALLDAANSFVDMERIVEVIALHEQIQLATSDDLSAQTREHLRAALAALQRAQACYACAANSAGQQGMRN